MAAKFPSAYQVSQALEVIEDQLARLRSVLVRAAECGGTFEFHEERHVPRVTDPLHSDKHDGRLVIEKEFRITVSW